MPADRLRDAERDRVPVAPLVQSFPGLTVADAYQIQLFNIARRDAVVVGHKVGLSSVAMQQIAERLPGPAAGVVGTAVRPSWAPSSRQERPARYQPEPGCSRC
jgi:2-keto-4-pentenoate hydratase